MFSSVFSIIGWAGLGPNEYVPFLTAVSRGRVAVDLGYMRHIA